MIEHANALAEELLSLSFSSFLVTIVAFYFYDEADLCSDESEDCYFLPVFSYFAGFSDFCEPRAFEAGTHFCYLEVLVFFFR